MVRFARRRPMLSLLIATAMVACTEQQFRLGFERDITPPSVAIVKSSGDTLDVTLGILFTVNAADNLGLKNITITMTGGFLGTIDTTFTAAITDIALGVSIPLPSNTTVGGTVVIQATVSDGNSNTAATTDSLFMINLEALLVSVIQPPTGQVTGPGVQMPVQIRATQTAGIRRVGYVVFGNVTAADSANYPLLDTAFFDDTLLVPVATPPGPFFIQGFAIDSANRRASSNVVTVTVQQILVDSFPPTVSFTVNPRVEVGDTIIVTASDFSGISRLGWIATDTTLAATVVGGDSVDFGTPVSPISRAFRIVISPAAVGQVLRFTAFAIDAAGNRGEARLATDPAVVRQDTVLVVHGSTRSLPVGGRIVDAVYNPNRDEVYLTNISRGRLEVFRIVDTSFGAAGVLLGAQPWGIALWPRDTTTGANADTVVVANSGGTNLSVMNVAVSPPREVRRQALPLYRVQTVETELDPAGFLTQKITEYAFDDRPQYLGVVCRGASCKPGGAGDVIAVYATTPTLGQTNPFPRKASLRWENLTSAAPESHFFWEHAAAQAGSANDTLQIFVKHGGTETLLLHALCGVRIALSELGFLDTTFVRNSGNFARAFIGEGGTGSPALAFSRAIAYDGQTGIDPTCPVDLDEPPDGIPDADFPLTRDNGISAALNVRNLITNSPVKVTAIGVNFNGLTNLVRADSIHVYDQFLRLQGSILSSPVNAGLDVNFNHDFDAKLEPSPTGLSPNDRITFAASDLPVIDVFDTYFYGKITSIPIRDPVTGPIRVAKLPSGEQILVGVTARGVVLVRLPAIVNTFQGARR